MKMSDYKMNNIWMANAHKYLINAFCKFLRLRDRFPGGGRIVLLAVASRSQRRVDVVDKAHEQSTSY